MLLNIIYTYNLLVSNGIIVFTYNIGFPLLYLCSTQLLKDCLLCQHIYQMDPVNESCQCSGGTVCPESSNLIKTICYDKLHQQHYDVLDLPFSLYCCSVISLSNHYLLLVHYSASLIETISNVPALTKDITM